MLKSAAIYGHVLVVHPSRAPLICTGKFGFDGIYGVTGEYKTLLKGAVFAAVIILAILTPAKLEPLMLSTFVTRLTESPRGTGLHTVFTDAATFRAVHHAFDGLEPSGHHM